MNWISLCSFPCSGTPVGFFQEVHTNSFHLCSRVLHLKCLLVSPINDEWPKLQWATWRGRFWIFQYCLQSHFTYFLCPGFITRENFGILPATSCSNPNWRSFLTPYNENSVIFEPQWKLLSTRKFCGFRHLRRLTLINTLKLLTWILKDHLFWKNEYAFPTFLAWYQQVP